MKRKSLTTFIIINFIEMAAIIAAFTYLIFQLSQDALYSIQMAPSIASLEKQEKLLKSEKYDKLYFKNFFSSKGYIEVLDENANVIYCSKDGVNNTYSQSVVDYISEIEGETSRYIDKLVTDTGDTVYLVDEYKYHDDGENQWNSRSALIVLDKNGKAIYATNEDEVLAFSKDDLKAITSANSTIDYLEKYTFTNEDGQTRYMIFHLEREGKYFLKQYKRIMLMTILAIIILVAIAIAFFGYRIVKAVKKPIAILQQSMRDVVAGNDIDMPDYKGPYELEMVLSSFKKMSKDLHASQEQEKKLQEEKQKMLADISHDLKTPITVIVGYIEAIVGNLVTEDQHHKYLLAIRDKANSMTELINSFYEFSKLEHPDFRLSLERGDICEYFREYMALKYDDLQLMGYDLIVDIPETSMEMSFDKTQLKRVFENIISNSLKHTKEGTSIYGAIKSKNGCVDILIGDTGDGIPHTLKDNIFDPFTVGDEARTSGKGTGLGLSIAKRITEAHGGRINLLTEDELPQFASELNLKTLFDIRLYYNKKEQD